MTGRSRTLLLLMVAAGAVAFWLGPGRRLIEALQRTSGSEPPPPAAPVAPRLPVAAEPETAEPETAEPETAEPWEGYDEMPAKDIVARVRGANGQAAAAVARYEAAHKSRKTVLAAAERALRD